MGRDETWIPDDSNPSATWSEDGSADGSDPSATWGPDQVPTGPGGASDRVVTETPDRYADPINLGKGAMGDVTAVWDTHLERLVARKSLRHDIPPHKQALARERFLREARVTARLEHPGIVPVYELGRSGEGRFYYTMLKVQGESLSEALKRCDTLHERLALVPRLATAAHAVGYAHDRKVVHRDLKPANVMLGEFGETLVIDWGLARELDTDETLESGVLELPTHGGSSGGVATVAGSVLGTPRYMCPEQARGESVTPASDVWSLGMIMLEVLSGLRWHPELDARGLVEALRAGARPDVDQIADDAPPELRAIADRALSLHPAERYPTAEAFAEELDAWLVGDRVDAYRYSGLDLVRRFLRRNKLVVATVAIAGVVVVALAAFAAQRVLAERDRAVDAEHRALDALDEALAGRLIARARTQELAGELPRAVASLRAAESLMGDTPELDVEIERLVRASGWARVVGESREMWGAIVARGPTEVVGGRLDGVVMALDLETDTITRLGKAPGLIRAVEPLDEGVVFAGADGQVRLAHDDGTERVLTEERLTGMIIDLERSPDRRRFLALGVSMRLPGEVAVFDAASGAELWRTELMGLRDVDWSPSGDRLVQVAASGIWQILDADSGRILERGRVDDAPRDSVWIDDERFLLVGSQAIVWGPNGAEAHYETTGGRVSSVAVGSRWWVFGDRRGRLRIVDREQGVARTVEVHDGQVAEIHLDPPFAITGSHDGTVGILDLRSGTLIQELGGHVGGVADLVVVGDRVVVSAEDEALTDWKRVEPARRHRLTRGGSAAAGAYDPLGKVVAVGQEDGTVALYDARTGEQRWSAPVHERDVRALTFVPGGLVSSGWDRQMVYTGLDGVERARVGFDGSAGLVRQGDWIWAAGSAEEVGRWNWKTGELLREPVPGHSVYSGDARAGVFATGGWDGQVGLWTDDLEVTWLHAAGRVWDVEISNAGDLLASATSEGLVQIWGLDGPTLQAEVRMGDEPAYVVAWTPDGRLVSGDARGRVRIDGPPWSEHQELSGLEDSVLDLWVSNDEIVALGADGRWMRWDIETGDPLASGLSEANFGMDVSSDGRQLVLFGGPAELWTMAGLSPLEPASNLRVCAATDEVVAVPLDWDQPFAPEDCGR